MTGKLQKIHSQAAGIDVGSLKFFVGVENEEVRDFDTFTSGCHQVAEYLQQKDITTVAMEATGVYWTTLYDMLTAVGIEVCVVNGIKQYEQQLNKQKIKWLEKQAAALNLQLLPNNA